MRDRLSSPLLGRYELHVLMVEHGKRCERCAKNGKPRKEPQGPCPLTKLPAASSTAAERKQKEGRPELKQEPSSSDADSMAEENKDCQDHAEIAKGESRNSQGKRKSTGRQPKQPKRQHQG